MNTLEARTSWWRERLRCLLAPGCLLSLPPRPGPAGRRAEPQALRAEDLGAAGLATRGPGGDRFLAMGAALHGTENGRGCAAGQAGCEARPPAALGAAVSPVVHCVDMALRDERYFRGRLRW